MQKRMFSFFKVLMFNLICLGLMSAVLLYRTDGILAQSSDKGDDVALVPRSAQATQADDDDDDDDDASDPPTDNDGTDSDGIDTTGQQDDTVITYTIRPAIRC